jgi:molybdopterin converting factor small subunit
MITFELFPGVGDLMKQARFQVEFTGKTLLDALHVLIEDHPHLAGDLMDSDANISRNLAFFINDEQISGDSPSERRVVDGDRITILPPIAGG